MKKLLIILIFFVSTSVFSFEKTTNFTFDKFQSAQKNDKTIVVNAWNKSCTVCASQSKIFAEAINDFKDVEFLFYEQTKHKNIAKELNIKFWTTIVVYKGDKEITREIGLNKKEEIYKLIKKGI